MEGWGEALRLPSTPESAILPGILGAAGGCWIQEVAPGLAQAWLCTSRL